MIGSIRRFFGSIWSGFISIGDGFVSIAEGMQTFTLFPAPPPSPLFSASVSLFFRRAGGVVPDFALVEERFMDLMRQYNRDAIVDTVFDWEHRAKSYQPPFDIYVVRVRTDSARSGFRKHHFRKWMRGLVSVLQNDQVLRRLGALQINYRMDKVAFDDFVEV